MPDKPDGIPSGASQTAVLPLYEWPTNRFGVRAPLPEPHIYLVRISHQLSAVARDTAVSTSLRSITVLDILSKSCRYALTRARLATKSE
jgi:hypothetical protein